MIAPINSLPEGKKIYFISDFHLGVPSHGESLDRERKIIRFLNSIEKEAHSIYLVGDVFDFWFEYKYVIPKGHVRLQGKLAELTDKGIPVYMFKGNHDMWSFGYFLKEMNIPVFSDPIEVKVGDKSIIVGHGDGLGPGDGFYKFLKWIFRNRFFQWVFRMSPPSVGMGIAHIWSKHSRIQNKDDKFLGENEWLYQYCKEEEVKQHHDYYIFGHRHLPLDLEVGHNSRYINLGEWVHYFTYAVFDGKKTELKTFEE
jgi:UDP-2,3-diacylglucosamine hydrolase